MSHIIRAATALFLLTGAASAQSALVEVSDRAIVAPFNQTADTVDDWDVYGVDGTKIGEVEEVLGTDANTATALAVDFEGNGGFADRDVIVPLDQFSFTDNRLVLNASGADVGNMPAYDD